MNSSPKLLDEERDVSSTGTMIFGNRSVKYMPIRRVGLIGDATTAQIVTFPAYVGYGFVTAPRIVFTFTRTAPVRIKQAAIPVVSSIEFESNPIVRVYPTTGKRYPMKVVQRSRASFEPTSLQLID